MRPYPETKNTKHHPRRQLPLKMGLNQSQNSSWMKVSLKKTHNSIIRQQQVKFRIFLFVEEYCCGLMTVMLLELLGRQRNQQKKQSYSPVQFTLSSSMVLLFSTTYHLSTLFFSLICSFLIIKQRNFLFTNIQSCALKHCHLHFLRVNSGSF